VRKGLKRNKLANENFKPVRLLDLEGSYTGINFSKRTFKNAIFKGLKSPKYLEIIGLTITAYIFIVTNSSDFLKSLLPTILIAAIIYFIQVIQTTFQEFTKENINFGW
jgi:hypothetical protein